LAYRHKCGQRTLHDLGDLSTGCPVDLLVVYSSHYCSPCRKHFNIALNDVASLGGHYTHRVIQMAVRPVVEDGLPYLEQALTLLDDTLLPATSNAVERGNRRHRKRQKSVYRVRSKVCLEGRI
jgi:hypothetical protein